MPVFNIAILCVWVGEGMVVCVGGSVDVLMRFVWKWMGVEMGVLGRRWVCVWGVGGWVSELWTSGIVNMLILTLSMRIVAKEWTEFWKKTLVQIVK